MRGRRRLRSGDDPEICTIRDPRVLWTCGFQLKGTNLQLEPSFKYTHKLAQSAGGHIKAGVHLKLGLILILLLQTPHRF